MASSVILSVPSGGRNERSLMKHHAVRKIICTSDDFAVAGGLQAVWNVPESSPDRGRDHQSRDATQTSLDDLRRWFSQLRHPHVHVHNSGLIISNFRLETSD